MIKYNNKKVIEVNDWDDLVEKTYNRPYSFQQQEGCMDRGIYSASVPSEVDDSLMNDVIPEEVNGEEMGVKFDVWLARDPKQSLVNGNEIEDQQTYINMWWERNFYPSIEMVANDLYKKGLIEAGDYTINIDW